MAEQPRRARHARYAVLLWALVATAFGCGPESASVGGEAAESVWSLAESPDLVIGMADGAAEYLFQNIVGARLLADGRIVVADRGTASVRVFGSDGSFLREVGGSGEGPGEFVLITRLTVTPSDTILIYDSRAFRLTRYLPDGTLLETLSMIPGGGRPETLLGTYSNGDLAFAWLKPYPRAPDAVTVDSMRLGRFGPDGRFKSMLVSTTGMHRFGNPLPFTPRMHAFLVSDSIVLTDGLGPDLTVLGDQGELVRTFGVATEPIDPADAWAALRDELEARAAQGEENRWASWLETAPDVGSIPRIADVFLDDEDRFWLKRYDPRTDSWLVGGLSTGRGGHWWIVDWREGVVATIQLPEDVTPLDVRGDRLLGMTRDDLGVQRVVRFEILR